MSGKEKRRCGRCGKAFKPANAKQVLCADCEAKERQARAAAKVAVAKPTSATTPALQPKIVGPGAGILVPGMTPPPAEPSAHAPAPAHGATHPQSGHQREHEDHRASHHTNQPTGHTSHSGHGGHTATAHEKPGAGAKPVHAAKTPAEPKAPRAPRAAPPAPVIQLTDELRAKIEQRYLELAQPVEFDGIRTQIATELSVPKALVKKAVLELRQRMQMPSWWELQSYDGGESDLERIRAAYLPLLPVPDVGAHKQIAETLRLDPRVVYQGIRRLRAEMRLPQYNPPDAHTSADASTAEAGAS